MDDLTGDLVIASLVFDVVAVTDKMFRSCLANVTDNALRQGGLIVIQGSLNEKCYTVGSSVFPGMPNIPHQIQTFSTFGGLLLHAMKRFTHTHFTLRHTRIQANNEIPPQ